MATFPVKPRSLVLPRLSFPGFENSTLRLRAVGSPAAWAREILQRAPAGERVESARLREERFSEGVFETLRTKQGTAVSVAELLGTHAGAEQEAAAKLSDEVKALGPGAHRFEVPVVSGAAGVGSAGADRSAIVFTSGRCVLRVGSARKSSASRSALVLAAQRLARRVVQSCR
ncbi:MAG TPA: hypothetical protein VGG08_00800 [Solirubrobacteraceae bacterium]